MRIRSEVTSQTYTKLVIVSPCPAAWEPVGARTGSSGPHREEHTCIPFAASPPEPHSSPSSPRAVRTPTPDRPGPTPLPRRETPPPRRRPRAAAERTRPQRPRPTSSPSRHSTSASPPRHVTVPAAGTYDVAFSNTGAMLHDVTFADGTTLSAAGGETATGTVTVPEGGLTFICSIPGHGDAGMKGEVTVGGDAAMAGMHAAPGCEPGRGGTATEAERPGRRPGRPEVRAVRPRRAGRAARHDPRHRPADHREGHHGRRRLRRPCLDVRRNGPRPDDPRPPRRHRQRASHQQGRDDPLHRLPRERDGDEPPDGGDRPRRHVHLHVRGRATPACGCTTAAPPRRCTTSRTACSGWSSWSPRAACRRSTRSSRSSRASGTSPGRASPRATRRRTRPPRRPTTSCSTASRTSTRTSRSRSTTGGRVRVFVLDAGPSIDSSFHVVGTIFDQVTKEGVQLLRGNAGGWGSQAVDLAPAQGAIVEFTPTEDGMYPFVTHAFNLVTHGAIGIFTAGDGDPLN